MTAHHGPDRRDDGLTLIELLITVALFTMVLAVTGTILVSSLKVQSSVDSLGAASNGAQLVARTLQRGIGNASAFKAEAPTLDGQLLRARVAVAGPSGAPTWRCVAWYYSATDKTIRTTSSGTAMVPVPTTTTLTTWTLLATRVRVADGATQAFSGAGSQLQVRLAIGAGSTASSVLVATTVAAGPESDTTTAPATCF
jgi:prepilin-type N-terminal cleavage/methylation domain-containing protein